MNLLIVGFGGFFGSICRYSIYIFEKKINPSFPFATLFINTLGCLIAGLLIGWASRALPHQKEYIVLGSIGFIGSFTTFSTFSAETFNLIRSEQTILALTNIVLSIILGLLAIWIGTRCSQ